MKEDTSERGGMDEIDFEDSTPRYHPPPHDTTNIPTHCGYLMGAHLSPNPMCSPDSPSPPPSPTSPPALISSTVNASPPTKADNVDPKESTAINDGYKSSTFVGKKEGGVMDSRGRDGRSFP